VPRTYDYILAKCKQYPVSEVLSDKMDIFDYNIDSSQSYMSLINISVTAREILKILRLYPHIPLEFLDRLIGGGLAGKIDPIEKSRACAELLDWHIMTESDGVYFVSPSLTSAIDRDLSLALSDEEEKELAKRFISILAEYSDEGKIPVSAVDAAGIACIEASDSGNWSRSFVLPSHYIYLGRRAYDQRKFPRAIKHFENALSSRSLLMELAFEQAARYLGMSAVRQSNDAKVDYAVSLLKNSKNSRGKAWALDRVPRRGVIAAS
jgi:hypothetical protein